jgi:pimeloyl-ACP methyl ester carboxylesterase
MVALKAMAPDPGLNAVALDVEKVLLPDHHRRHPGGRWGVEQSRAVGPAPQPHGDFWQSNGPIYVRTAFPVDDAGDVLGGGFQWSEKPEQLAERGLSDPLIAARQDVAQFRVGTLVGSYTGAAATTYGLALLGGGSLAAGGLGMAGGTAVVAAMGGVLGGGLGALVTTAYIGDDKSFSIEKIADCTGTPVIVTSGFLTEGGNSWGTRQKIIQRRYPESPVYRVYWGSKELAALKGFVVGGVGKAGMGFAVKTAAAKAVRVAAKKLGPLGPMLVAADLLKNAWHTAKVRADRTGVALAGLMARTDADSYILVGHSLGARAMVTAAQTLATDTKGPRVATAHLLGAAIGAKGDWRSLNDAATDAIYNYHSANDKVLKYLYTAVQAGSVPAGLRGFGSKFPKIKDRNVSRLVNSHSDYFDKVNLV